MHLQFYSARCLKIGCHKGRGAQVLDQTNTSKTKEVFLDCCVAAVFHSFQSKKYFLILYNIHVGPHIPI